MGKATKHFNTEELVSKQVYDVIGDDAIKLFDPKALEMLEAVRIDGAGEVQTFTTIVLPMIKPGIGALAIFTFIGTWNDYFLQLIMLNSSKVLTISLGIAKLQSENSSDFGLIMAGAALASVPIVAIFIMFQKYFTQGITMGAVKG